MLSQRGQHDSLTFSFCLISFSARHVSSLKMCIEGSTTFLWVVRWCPHKDNGTIQKDTENGNVIDPLLCVLKRNLQKISYIWIVTCNHITIWYLIAYAVTWLIGIVRPIRIVGVHYLRRCCYHRWRYGLLNRSCNHAWAWHCGSHFPTIQDHNL
jgi:hypothetical protein